MKAKMMLYGIESTIDRLVDITVGNDLRKLMGITNKVYITYDEAKRDVIRKKGLTGARRSNTIKHDIITVIGREEGEENSGTVLYPERQNDYSVFQDSETGVKVGALKYMRKRTIEFTYFSQSKTTIDSMVNKIRTFDIFNNGSKAHKLEFHYDMPTNLLHFLNNVNDLRNKRQDRKEDLYDYIGRCMVTPWSRKNTNSNLPYKFNLSIREHLYNVVGLCTTDTYHLEKEQGDSGYWSFTISYDFWYLKPLMLILEYPLLIWNSPLDPIFTNCIARPIQRSIRKGNVSNKAVGLYSLSLPQTDMIGNKYLVPLNIPTYDTFNNWPTNRSYANVVSMLVLVDDKDPYYITNIRQLPYYTIKEPFVKYMLEYHNDVTKSYKNLFNVLLYRDGKEDYRNKLLLDKDGNLTTEFPMDIKSTYRIVIRVLRDLDMLDTKDLDKLNIYVQKEMDRFVAELDKIEQGSNNGTGSNYRHNRPLSKYRNPHNIKPKYYVDEYGNIIDESGYVVYTDGTRVVEEI